MEEKKGGCLKYILLAFLAVFALSGILTLRDSIAEQQGGQDKSSYTAGTLEHDLSQTLPADLKTYIHYDYDTSAECILNVTSLTVNRHSTEGNYSIADCTIMLEDARVKKTAFVELRSLKYDTGWVVQSWTPLQEPQVTPKYEPDTARMDNMTTRYGFKSIANTFDNLDMDAGMRTRVYAVSDAYEYVCFTGDLVVTAQFKAYKDSDETVYQYYWYYSVENSTVPIWDISGTWTLSVQNYATKPEDIVTISLRMQDNADTETITGESVKYYLENDGRNWLETYGSYPPTDISCKVTGEAPSDLLLTVYGSKGYVEISAEGCQGYISGDKCQSVVLARN